MNRLEIFEQVYGPTEWSEAALLSLMKVYDLVYAEGFNAGIGAAARVAYGTGDEQMEAQIKELLK